MLQRTLGGAGRGKGFAQLTGMLERRCGTKPPGDRGEVISLGP